MTDAATSPPWSNPKYWTQRFVTGDTPWQLDGPSAVLTEACAELDRIGISLEGRRVVVPGCGRGHDAIMLVKAGAFVTAVDWSEDAVTSLKERAALEEKLCAQLEIVYGDFFKVLPTVQDAAVEHTFFCALDPSLRKSYAQQISKWIVPGGYLLGNFFIVQPEELAYFPRGSLTREREGPPFATTTQELQDLLNPFFTSVLLRQANDSERTRKEGLEWVGIFQKR